MRIAVGKYIRNQRRGGFAARLNLKGFRLENPLCATLL